MADNLGTLWFGADVDLKELKKNIAQGNKDILDALKMNYDPKSYQDMVNNLRSTLSKEQFEIKLTANTKGLFGQGVNNKQLNFGDLPQKILDQQKLVNGLISRVATLRAEYSRTGSDYIRDTLLPDALTKLAKERQVLNDLKATRAAYNQSLADSNKARRQASESARQLTSDGIRLNATLLGGIHVSTQLGSALSSVFAVDAARQFLHNIVEIGGQLEKQRISMGAIIGDTARANELFDQIKSMALKSPFGVVELDQYSKQLAAYGIEQSNLLDMTKRLADISAGAGQDIGRLALALGHVKSATYLTGITLRQFSMNNIPMLKMLADYYSEVEKRAVSTAEVQKRISKRQVSYDDVVEQIKRMTDEGGQFYNMQEKISESVAAKWKNLKDSLDIMYGDLAESKIGDVLKGTAELLMELTTRWKTLLPVLNVAAATFGLIRVSTLAVNTGMAVFNAHALKNTAATKEMTVAQRWMNIEMQKGALNFTLFGTKVTALTRLFASFRIGMAGVAATAKALGASLLAAVPQMAILAGISALVGLWQRNNEEMDKAKELGDQLFNRTQEGLKNLKQMMKETGMAFRDQYGNISNLFGQTPGQFEIPDFKKIDTAQAAKSIEVWTKFIKEYAATPNLMLESAYATDENGKAVHSLAEQYEILGEKAKIVAESLPLISQFGEYLSEAIEESDSGWLDDNLLTDIKDFQDAYKNVRKEAQDLYREQQKATTYALEAARGNAEFSKALEDGKIKADDYTSQLVLLVTQYNKFSEAWAKFRDGWNATTDKSMSSFSLFTGGGIAEAERELEREFNEVADRLKAKMASSGIDPAKLTEPERLALTRAFTDMATKAGLSVDQVRDRVWELINEKFPAIRLDISEVETSAQVSAIEDELNKLVDGEFHIDISTATNAFDVIQKIREGYKSAKDAIENAKPILMKMGVSVSGVAAMTEAQINDLANGSEFIKSMLQGVKKAQIQINDALKASSYGFSLSDPNKGGKTFRDSDAAANKAKREAEKRAKDRTKMAEAQLKIDEELAKQRLELEDAIADAEVAAIKNNSARERAQRLNEMRKQERDLKKQVEEWKKTAFKALKEKYEADPNNKKVSFYDTPEGKAGWQGIPLTKEQEETYKQRWATMLATGEKSLKELVRAEHKANADAIQKYIEQFGTYEEKKKAIYEKANDEICDLQEQLTDDMTDEERQAIDAQIALVKKGAQDQVDELEVQYGKAKAFMIDLFEDVSEKSIKSLEKIIKKYEALRDFLKGEKNVTRSDLNLLGFSEKDIDKALEEYGKNPTDFLKKFLDRLKGVKKELKDKSIWKQFSLDFKEIQKSTEGEGYKIEKMADIAEQAIPIFAELGENMLAAFGIDDTGIKAATKSLQSLVGVVKGIGQIKSGDKLGGILSIASSVISVGTTFADYIRQNTNDEHRRILERVDRRLETTNERLTELNETISKSYGLEASAAADEAREQAELKRQQAWEALKKSSLVKEAKYDGQWYNVLAYIFEKFFGLDAGKVKNNFEGGMWEYIFAHNTEEEILEAFRKAREENSDVWAMLTVDPKVKEYIEMLLDLPDTVDQINEAERKSIVGMSFDDVKDDFLENLYAMADGSETVFNDIDKNWQKMLNRMVINNLVFNKFQDQLEDWYKRLSELQRKYNEGGISAEDYEKGLDDFLKEYQKMSSDANSEINTFTEMGIIKPIEEATNEAKKYFESLLDSWKSTLTDMSQTTEDWKNSLIDQVFSDLVESTILNVPIDVNTTEGEKHFDDFAKYLEDWTERYKKVMEDTTLTDEERNEKLKALIKEQTDVREEQAEKSKKIAESIGKDITEAFSNSLDGLGSTLLDGLLDTEKDAAQMGKEIGQTLVREMIQELLASEKYSGQINAIKKLWQNVLKGGGTWVDEQGLFGEANTVYNVDKVIGKITELDDAMANDDEITALTEKYRQFGYVAESSFGNLKDTFMDAVLDMEHGAENFAKKLNETLVKDLVNKKVFGEAFTLNGKEFANFDVYQKDWTKRYLDALEKGDKALMKELTKELREREKVMAESAEEYAKTLQDVAEDTTFKDMSDDFLNAVMDINKTAEDWGQQIGETMVKKILEGMLLKDKIMPIMEGIQKAFNDAVSAATNKETGKINWEEVINNPALTASVESGKKDFDEFQTAWKMLCEKFGVELNTLPLENIGDTVIDSLLDIEDSAEDFGRRMALQLMNEMLTTMVSNEFKEKIQTIRKMWQSVVNGDGEYTMQQVLDEIQDFRDAITKNEAANGLINSIKELSKTSEKVFSSMADSWTSTLMDMEGTAEDFVKSVGKMMAEKIITAMITPKFIQPILNAMQEAYDVAVNAAGATYKSVVSAMVPFLDQVKDVYEVVTPMIEEIFGSFGIFRETVEEVEEAVDEVEYALGDMKSEFSSALMDMESTAESFSKNIKNILAKTFVEKFILGDRFDAMMEQWQQQFEGILTGSMSDDQRKKSIQKLAESMTDYEQSLVGPVMSLLESLGLTTEDNQQATMNMSDKITYDQADQLLGINLAQELTLEQILAELQGKEILNVGSANRSLLRTSELMGNDEQGKLINATLTNIAQMTQQNHDNIMTQVAMANSHLQMIRDYNKRMCDQIELHMASMDTKLNNLSRL